MNKDNWVWMPHAGHFCGASKCLFKLNTYVGKYIVSTVGEYFPDGNKIEEIGMNRTYETMIFKAKKSTTHKCCPYVVSHLMELDMKGYNHPEDAYVGHIKLCKKWSKK